MVAETNKPIIFNLYLGFPSWQEILTILTEPLGKVGGLVLY